MLFISKSIIIIFRNGKQMKKLDNEVKTIIKDAAKRLTGFKRRAYQARITLDYFGGSARKAEREMGWGRESVEKGLKETESGIRCIDNFQGRGRNRTEDKLPNLREDSSVISFSRKDGCTSPVLQQKSKKTVGLTSL